MSNLRLKHKKQLLSFYFYLFWGLGEYSLEVPILAYLKACRVVQGTSPGPRTCPEEGQSLGVNVLYCTGPSLLLKPG